MLSKAVGPRIDPDANAEMVTFEQFVAVKGLRLRRALVARYGVEVGTESAADAMAYAWEHWTRIAALGNPLGYLFRVGQTSARKQHRWNRHPNFPAEPIDGPGAREPGLPSELAKLRPDERVAVVLVHGYHWSYAEVAALLDVPVSTIRNHVHRGTSRLRKALEG